LTGRGTLCSMNKTEVGKFGEQLAAQTLERQGYVILDRNWRGATGKARASGERRNRGELDIVALDGDTLVGIEVKTRTGIAYGHPSEAITEQKLLRMRRLLGQWLTENHANQPKLKWGLTEIRLDAVAVVLPTSNQASGDKPPNRTPEAKALKHPEVIHLQGIS